MTTELTQILLVDDDQKLSSLLVRYLKEQGLNTISVLDGTAMDLALQQYDIDLIILDIMLPGEDGISIAKRLRSESNIPIVMLSARGDDIEKIIGLETGADDYIAKPFNPRELLARIRAVLRRGVTSKAIDHTSSNIYHFGPFQLNLNNHSLYKDDQAIELTSGEYDLLEAFVTHADRLLSRDQLIDQLKGYERSPYDRSIDVRVTRLRKKLENPEYIRTVRGRGYMFIPHPENLDH